MQVLIDKNEVSKAAHLNQPHLSPIAAALMHVLSFNKVNELYARHERKQGLDFIDGILNDLGLTVEVPEEMLDRIPETGPFVTVSNHPMGGIEGLILIKVIAERRPDFKVVANYLLQKIEPISDFFLAVDPFDGADQAKNSVKGMLMAKRQLEKGLPIGFFPAGEVSTFQKDVKQITDRPWQKGVIKLIGKSNVPVVPVYFGGNIGPLFHVLGLIHPNLRTANLANQLFHKSGEPISLKIGNPIQPKFLGKFEKTDEMGRYLRAKTYALGSGTKVKPFFKFSLSPFKTKQPLAEPVAQLELLEEINQIEQLKIFSQGEFDVFIASHYQIPKVLQEIGRLRELTFREVGEGSNKKRDLDEFDLYYQHLFLWDKKNCEIVGAYRLGLGKEIISTYGKKGFYTASLFKYSDEFEPILNQSIELGRSFIVPNYQRKVLPLFILWKGILHFLLHNKGYRYLLGPVSISNYYSSLSKSLMVEFVRKHYFDDKLAGLVKPRKRFTFKAKEVDPNDLLKCGKSDLRFMDQLINDIEPNGMTMPVLLKKYIKQNARIIGFNVDPKFEKALDGLMILDLNDVPAKTLEDLQRDFEL